MPDQTARPVITALTETPVLDPQGRLKTSVTVSYTLGDHGPFSVTMDKAQFTADAARDLIEQDAQQWLKLLLDFA